MQKAYDNVCTAMPGGQTEKNSAQAEYAGFWVRFAAYIIDSLLVFAGLLIVRLLFLGVSGILEGTFLGGNVLFDYTLEDIVLYGVQVLYFVLCTYYAGTTVGKRALNLRVIGVGEEKPTLFSILYRETIGRFLSGVILGLGYLLIGVDREKRGLHDILCDTRVVYAKRIKVYGIYQGTPIMRVPSAQQEQAEREVLPVQQAAVNAPAMPEGSYRLVKPQDVETEKKEQQEERDS